MKNVMSRPAVIFKYLFLVVAAFAVAAACGYEDLNAEKEKMAAEYYADDSKARSALIEAETLKQYIDAGYVAADGKRVLILHIADQTGKLPQKSIKGAYGVATEAYVMEARSDGPVTDSAMVASGAKMDAFLREFGIDKNTLIVLTSDDLTKSGSYSQMLARAFWTFKYWGFSNKQVKVLNGTDKYFASKYATYMVPFRTDRPAPSTFSVKELPGGKMDSYRAPIGEVLGYVKAGQLKANGTGQAIMVSTMNPQTKVQSNSQTITFVISNRNAIDGRMNGETQLALSAKSGDAQNNGYDNAWTQYIDTTTGKFKTESELKALIKGLTTDGTTAAAFLPNDKNKRIMFHCQTGRTTAPHWFVVRELLGYTNAAVYDGSWSEWTNLTYYGAVNGTDSFVNQLGTDGKVATPATEYLTYDAKTTNFNISNNGGVAVVSPNSKQNNINWDTSRYTKFLTFNGKAPTATYDNSYNGDGREINKKDKAYQAGEFSADDGSTTGGGSSTGGGSTPAGC